SDLSERYIVFSDDLSFESGEASYKALKSILDGSIAGTPQNVLIYATSNRRHLMPEFMSENLETRVENGEIRPGDTTEEKVSLSERFGLWISFYPFDQDQYLAICAHWLASFGLSTAQIEAARQEALQWSLLRGARSGRVAWQFARDYAGRLDRGKKSRLQRQSLSARPAATCSAGVRPTAFTLAGGSYRAARSRTAKPRIRRWCESWRKSSASRSSAPIRGSCASMSMS